MCVNNSKWFPTLDENNMSFDDIVDFVRANEKVNEGGRFHKPILHSELLTAFRNRAENVGMKLCDTKVGLSRDGMKVMVVANSLSDKGKDYGLSCGFRNSTNSTQSFSGCFGHNCWICSNGCISGLVIPSKQRNTIGNYDRFGDKIDIIFDRFNSNKDVINNQITQMGSTKISDDIVGKFILKLIKDGSIGNTHICNMVRELDNPTVNRKDDDSCLKLLNAGTWVTTHEIKNPIQSMTASRVVNNTLMSIISEDFKPLGDDVVEVVD